MVLIGDLTEDAPRLIRVLYDLGYDGVMGSLYAFPTIPQYMDAFKGGEEFLLEGFYGVEEHSYEDDGSYADPDLRELVNEYRRREPGVPQSGLITSYNTMKILLEAIEAAQTVTDTDKVKHVLETGEWVNEFLPGDPVISFGEAGESNVPLTLRQRHMIWAPMAMNVYRGGKPQTIEVFSAAPIGPLPEHLVGPPVLHPVYAHGDANAHRDANLRAYRHSHSRCPLANTGAGVGYFEYRQLQARRPCSARRHGGRLGQPGRRPSHHHVGDPLGARQHMDQW